jgi:hypothetical protein
MPTRERARACLARLAGLSAILALPAAGDEPPPPLAIVRGTFVGSSFVLELRRTTPEWFALERSEELRSWTVLGNAAAADENPGFIDLGATERPRAFYRLRAPAMSPAGALAIWMAIPKVEYQYRLERLGVFPPRVLTGTVAVRGATKTISNAEADFLPVSDPDPALFPSVEELFDELERARADGIRQVWVLYDAVLAFPERVTLDRRAAGLAAGAGGPLVQYRISAMSVR